MILIIQFLIKKKRISFLKKYKNFFFYKVDIKNYNNLNNIFIKNKISLVYNFAAQAGVRYSLVNPNSYIQNNILGFFNILKISKDRNVKKFFYASSSSVYGESKKFPLKEETNSLFINGSLCPNTSLINEIKKLNLNKNSESNNTKKKEIENQLKLKNTRLQIIKNQLGIGDNLRYTKVY